MGDVTRTESRGSTFSSIADRVQRALSPVREPRRSSFARTMSEDARGRQPIVSTGRGGAGNLIRSPSRGVDPEVLPGGERGREITRDQSVDKVTHSGRGGAGNIRSPSRGPKEVALERAEDALQDRLIAESRGRQANQPISTGRGGAGNIARSKSRSRSAVREKENGTAAAAHQPSPVRHEVHTTGRGGFGNIKEEAGRDSVEEEKRKAAEEYEKDVREKHKDLEKGKLHTTGKGGLGNVSHTPEPDIGGLTLEEKEAYAKVHKNDTHHGISTGRGGGGNIHRADQSPADHNRGRDKQGGVFGSVLRSLSRAAGRDKSADGTKVDPAKVDPAKA